jgi:hypothetical protein
LTPRPADIDWYSKDHLEPELVDKQRVDTPTVVDDARRGVFKFAQNIQNITYQNKTFPIDADKEIRMLKLLSSTDVKTLTKLDIPDDLICCQFVKSQFASRRPPEGKQIHCLVMDLGKAASRSSDDFVFRQLGD